MVDTELFPVVYCDDISTIFIKILGTKNLYQIVRGDFRKVSIETVSDMSDLEVGVLILNELMKK